MTTRSTCCGADYLKLTDGTTRDGVRMNALSRECEEATPAAARRTGLSPRRGCEGLALGGPLPFLAWVVTAVTEEGSSDATHMSLVYYRHRTWNSSTWRSPGGPPRDLRANTPLALFKSKPVHVRRFFKPVPPAGTRPAAEGLLQ